MAGRGNMNGDSYRRGAWGPYFQGIYDGDFHTPGKAWLDDKVETILTDFANGQGKKWDDLNYWPASPAFPAQGK